MVKKPGKIGRPRKADALASLTLTLPKAMIETLREQADREGRAVAEIVREKLAGTGNEIGDTIGEAIGVLMADFRGEPTERQVIYAKFAVASLLDQIGDDDVELDEWEKGFLKGHGLQIAKKLRYATMLEEPKGDDIRYARIFRTLKNEEEDLRNFSRVREV